MKQNSAHSLHTGSVKGKITYFWLAGFYVKKTKSGLPPPSCSDTALSAVWGALARSQDAVCIAPAAAGATAVGCCLLALLLLPPPGSGGDGCCIRSCLAPHRHLACQSKGGGSEGAQARDGERAKDLQGSGLVERRRARIRPSQPGPGAPGTRRRRRRRSAQARAPGRGRDGSQGLGGRQGEWGKAGVLGYAELAWQNEITTRPACKRLSGGRGAGKARAAGRGCSRGAVKVAGSVLERRS